MQNKQTIFERAIERRKKQQNVEKERNGRKKGKY